ncbi:MAG TPA: hypothetical protein VL442_13470 [Mucilaginibacter sp.]|jgi:hypothetical protein|nr:hypothetical protein [Mucilaginibacter sp.]
MIKKALQIIFIMLLTALTKVNAQITTNQQVKSANSSLELKDHHLTSSYTADSLIVIKASISNLENMFKMHFDDWESALIKLGYGSKNIGSDNINGHVVSLFKSSTTTNNVHSVVKTDLTINIDWYHPSGTSQEFKDLMTELKPFYKGLFGGSPTYQIKKDGFIYQYVIVKYENGETVIMKRS